MRKTDDMNNFTLLIVSAFLITAIGQMVYILESNGTKIPDTYKPACDNYFGVDNWTTICMDWIDYDSDFGLKYGDLVYSLVDMNGSNGHIYGCMRK